MKFREPRIFASPIIVLNFFKLDEYWDKTIEIWKRFVHVSADKSLFDATVVSTERKS